MNSENTWVIVPAFNEAGVIYAVIKALADKNYHVVVVDDASTDQTVDELSRLPVDICRHSVNLGQGAALQTGICYALEKGAKYLVTFDADGQHNQDDIPGLLEPLYSGNYDVVLGTRFHPQGNTTGMPAARRDQAATCWLVEIGNGDKFIFRPASVLQAPGSKHTDPVPFRSDS